PAFEATRLYHIPSPNLVKKCDPRDVRNAGRRNPARVLALVPLLVPGLRQGNPAADPEGFLRDLEHGSRLAALELVEFDQPERVAHPRSRLGPGLGRGRGAVTALELVD